VRRPLLRRLAALPSQSGRDVPARHTRHGHVLPIAAVHAATGLLHGNAAERVPNGDCRVQTPLRLAAT